MSINAYHKSAQEIEELQQSVQNNIILECENSIIVYYVNRYQQELQYKSFKNDINLQIKEIKQELAEHGIYVRRVEDAIRMYKNMDNIGDFNVDDVFKIIMINIGKVNTTWIYEDNEELIKDSIIKLIDLKQQIKNFKNNQSIELSKLSNAIKDEGLAFYIIQQRYTSLKNKLKFFMIECRSDKNILTSNEVNELMAALDIVETKAFNTIIEGAK